MQGWIMAWIVLMAVAATARSTTIAGLSDLLELAAHFAFLLVCVYSIQRWVESEQRDLRVERRRFPPARAVLLAVCLAVALVYYFYTFRHFYIPRRQTSHPASNNSSASNISPAPNLGEV